MKKSVKFARILFPICLFLIAGLSGCATTEEQGEPPSQEPTHGQVTLFMNGPERASLDITFEIIAVNVIAEDGTVREIMNTPLKVNSLAMIGHQISLGERTLPEGTYTKVQFIVKGASVRKKEKPATLALPPEGINVDARFTISRRVNTTIFFSWSPDASVVDGYLFRPAFLVKRQMPELNTLMVYVTNEGSDNVSVINRQTDEVVATIMVGRRPRGIAVGTKKDGLKVYVANSGSNSISVIDPTTNKVETEIPIRFGWSPESIAVGKTGPDKELIFVANYSSNTVSVVDGSTYQEIDKISTGNGPIAVAADPPADTLLTSRTLSQDSVNILKNYREKFINVYVANRNSKDVTVARMDAATGRSLETFNVGVEWSPMSVNVDYQRGKLYVTNYDSDKLSVIDILRVVRGNKTDLVGTINNIGTAGIGTTTDSTFDRLYFLREVPGEVLVVRPFSESGDVVKSQITPIVDVIGVGGDPRALLMDPEARKLYIVNRGANTVSVMDKTTRKLEQVVPVGKRPYGIAVFPR